MKGLQIVIIDQDTHQVKLAKVFDTYESAAAFDDFIRGDLEKGSIVAAACQDDCVSHLSQDAKNWFVYGMGSKEVTEIQYRQGFAFIGTFGSRTTFEKRAIDLGKVICVQ